jgi:hypothetical protein
MGSFLSRPRPRRAVAFAFVVISLVMLLSFVALAVDAGYIYVSRSQMQWAADAAALAGASMLEEGETHVRARAVECAESNKVAGSHVTDQEVTVTIGNWEWSDRAFSPATGAEVITPNAVRVEGVRTDVPLFLAPVMGIDTTDLNRDATALVGSGVCAGIWGLEGVTGDGTILTDSYDSQEGGYGAGPIYPNGDICSCQGVALAGDVEIRGDVMHGEGHSVTTSGSAYSIWGVVAEHQCGAVVPPFDMADAAIHNDNLTIGLTDRGHDPFGGSPWDLVVTGNDNLTLMGGKYYFTSAVIDGRATLTIAGPTTIYLSGPSEFTGNGVTNLSQDPADLIIYSTGATMALSGTAGFYGAVIAPATDIELVGTGDYYGTILGRTLDMDGTAVIHVDESLVSQLFGLEAVSPVLVE